MIILSLLSLLCGIVVWEIYRAVMVRAVSSQSEVIARVAAFVAQGSGDVAALRGGVSLRSFALAVVYVASHIELRSHSRVEVVVRYYLLDSYLLNSALKCRNSDSRAYNLALLAHLPMDDSVVEQLLPLLHDNSGSVRFSALMAIVAARPDVAVVALGALRTRLTYAEVAQLLSVLCRGICLVPCTPLLFSDNYNMQLFGLALVRRFGIAECRSRIVEIVEQQNHPLRQQAVEALASFSIDELQGQNTVTV